MQSAVHMSATFLFKRRNTLVSEITNIYDLSQDFRYTHDEQHDGVFIQKSTAQKLISFLTSTKLELLLLLSLLLRQPGLLLVKTPPEVPRHDPFHGEEPRDFVVVHLQLA